MNLFIVYFNRITGYLFCVCVKERERETDRQTDRQTEKENEKVKEKETHRKIELSPLSYAI